MSRSQRSTRTTSIFTGVRMPRDLHAALIARGPISAQIIEATRRMLAGSMLVPLADRPTSGAPRVAHYAPPFSNGSADLPGRAAAVRRSNAAGAAGGLLMDRAGRR